MRKYCSDRFLKHTIVFAAGRRSVWKSSVSCSTGGIGVKSKGRALLDGSRDWAPSKFSKLMFLQMRFWAHLYAYVNVYHFPKYTTLNNDCILRYSNRLGKLLFIVKWLHLAKLNLRCLAITDRRWDLGVSGVTQDTPRSPSMICNKSFWPIFTFSFRFGSNVPLVFVSTVVNVFVNRKKHRS